MTAIQTNGTFYTVALFTRAWIEMLDIERPNELFKVALFTRAWIEILRQL